MKLLRICRIALYCLLALCITLSTATLYYLHVQHRPSADAQRLFDEADQLRWNDQWLLVVPIYTTGSHTIRVEGGAYAHSMTTSVTVPHFRRSSCPEAIVRLTQDPANSTLAVSQIPTDLDHGPVCDIPFLPCEYGDRSRFTPR